MRVASGLALTAVVLATAALARAADGVDPGDVTDGDVADVADVADGADVAEVADAPVVTRPLTDPARAPLDVQLSARLAAARRAHEQVATKLAEREDILAHRVRAAYKLLRGFDAPLAVAPERRLAVARSRATARWLLVRDRDEVDQLRDEVDHLARALGELDDDLADVGPVPPIYLARPVPGAIVRGFGSLVHPGSQATLTHHGLDLAADRGDTALAPADGVVRYAGPIRGLDQGVILDHGGLWTVVARLGTLAVARGDNVTRGDALGHPAAHLVYLEARVPVGAGGTPVDPVPLLR